MGIDKDKIKKRFSEINESLTEIQRLSSLKDEEFWVKKENLDALKYNLLIAIEAVGSICVHIAAKKFNKAISVFGECFEVLEKERFLDKKLADSLKKMTKFRNILIHQYWKIDDKKVLDYARNDINDFKNFIKSVDKLL